MSEVPIETYRTVLARKIGKIDGRQSAEKFLMDCYRLFRWQAHHVSPQRVFCKSVRP